MQYRFRVQDLNFSSFTALEKRRIASFQNFIKKRPDGYCCVCMKILYPEERKYRQIDCPENLPCLEWDMQPLLKPDCTDKYMVCLSHTNTSEESFIRLVYPGKLIYNFYDLLILTALC